MSRVDFAAKQRRVEDGVLKCVNYDGACLNDYRRLVLQYWTIVDGAAFYDPERRMFCVYNWNVHRLTSPESISRALRKLIEHRVVALGADTREHRDAAREEFRGYHLEEKDSS